MEIKNQIAKRQTANAVTYESSGTQVTLSPETIKRYLVSGGGAVTDQEVMMFLGMCQAQKLNPFNREAYLVKYGSNSPATMIVGKDVFLKRAQMHPDFDGLEAGIIVMTQDGQIQERNGTFYLPESETLVGGWCKVYQKGRRIPSYESVNLSEYIGRNNKGDVNAQWSKRPATMIRKVALTHALKEAFPNDLGGMYAQEEMDSISDIQLDETPVVVPQNPEPEPVYEQTVFDQTAGQIYPEEAPAADPAAALFGM